MVAILIPHNSTDVKLRTFLSNVKNYFRGVVQLVVREREKIVSKTVSDKIGRRLLRY